MSGWICSYRAIWDHPIFEGDAQRVGVWTWMLHTAAWKPTRFRIGSSVIELSRGQLCISQRQAEEATGMGRTKLRNFLRELEGEHAITQDATHGRTIITICKYEEYQERKDRGEPKSNPETTQRQPTKEQINKLTTIPVGEADASSTVEVSVTSSAVWNAGKPFLASRGVKDPGPMIGRWLKNHSPLEILSAIEAAQKSGSQDPIPYITEALKGERREKSSKSEDRLNAFVAGARGSS